MKKKTLAFSFILTTVVMSAPAMTQTQVPPPFGSYLLGCTGCTLSSDKTYLACHCCSHKYCTKKEGCGTRCLASVLYFANCPANITDIYNNNGKLGCTGSNTPPSPPQSLPKK